MKSIKVIIRVEIAFDSPWMKVRNTIRVGPNPVQMGFPSSCYDDDENMPEMHLDETLDNVAGASGIGGAVSVAKSGNTDLGVGPHESPMLAN